MGDMGQRRKSGSKKRGVKRRRRSSKGRPVLAWLPDSSLPKHAGAKHALNSWMNHSFKVSNPNAMLEGMLPSSVVTELKDQLDFFVNSIGDDNTQGKVAITPPEKDYHHWTSEIEFVSNGTLRKTEINSVTLGDVFEESLTWLMYQARS